MTATPILAIAMWGGVVGLMIVAVIVSVILWLRGPESDSDAGCDCFTCTTAREWREREEGWS